MADAVISFAIQKIADAITNEALFAGSVRQQAEKLKRELTWMKSFLQEADAKARGGNELVQNWVKEVREAAYDAEDLIESIAIQGSEPGMGQKRRGLSSNFMPGAPIPRHNSATNYEELKKRIKNIRESAAAYGITALPNDLQERKDVDEAIVRRRALALHALNSSHVVRMEDEKASILDRLDPKREKRRSVVSIVRMGRLGKTTLAKKVFEDSQIQSRFDCAFWINVSQDYQEVKLLKDLLCRISPERKREFETMEMTQLGPCLHESLLGKTYLIVMDDVWDGEVWRIFGEHLPDEGNGSKVLITTRNRTVAAAADPDQANGTYELRFLNRKESWELFISTAIPREEDRSECTGRLKELGEQMAEKCGSLPLALVVVGGLLSAKQRSIAEWERVSESMVWQNQDESMVWQNEDESMVWQDQDKIMVQNCLRILHLGYLDLPYDLKWCFLYLSAFPEDFEIESDRLIRLWIAEGFIAESAEGLTLEETAESQLEKLIERSLVLVVSWRERDGVIICKVHHLLRELCISEAKQIDFMSVHHGTSPLPTALSHRRLSVITKPEETISRLKFAPRLRALLGFNFNLDYTLRAMNLSAGGLRLIRVIDLEEAFELKVLPKEIGDLVNLRYLGLRGTNIKSLPKTIENLSRLQFLDVRETAIEKMTSAVWEIETLRQLFSPRYAKIHYMGQCRWRSLQVLSMAATDDWMDDSLHQIKDITTLEIWQINAFDHAVLSLNLPQFSILKNLKLEGSSIPWTALKLSGLHLLHTLQLKGPVKSTFPEEVRPGDIPGSLRDLSSLERDGFVLDYAWPAGLTYLELWDSDLHRDPLPSLGQLSELRFLTLMGDVYSWGKGMKFRRDEFKRVERVELRSLDCMKRIVVEDGAMPRLQELELQVLKILETMTVEDGAMPRLQKLKICNCGRLETMTVEDGAMPRLQKLKISYCGRLETIPRRLEDVAEWER